MRIVICFLVVALLLSSCAAKRKVVVPPTSSLTPWRDYGETLKEVCSPGRPTSLDGAVGTVFKFGCIRALEEIGFFETIELWVDDPEVRVSDEAKRVLSDRKALKKALEEAKKK